MENKEENNNLTGDVVSIHKVGEEIVITKEAIKDDLNYADLNSKDPMKPDMIKTGVEESVRTQRFPSKEKAIEHYKIQLERCNKGLDKIKENLKDLEKDIMDPEIFERISKIQGKLDKNMYKGKYKALETYLEKHAHYKQGLAQIDIRSGHIPYFEKILETIEAL